MTTRFEWYFGSILSPFIFLKKKHNKKALSDLDPTLTKLTGSAHAAIVLRKRDTKESTFLLRHITTEKSGLCQYAVRITQNTTFKKVASTEWL